jgi:hypothetical protein
MEGELIYPASFLDNWNIAPRLALTSPDGLDKTRWEHGWALAKQSHYKVNFTHD